MFNPQFISVPQLRPVDVASDEFFMYIFKIKRCPKSRSHDWTECPFSHKGEKARRRDPSKFHYSGIICPHFRNGSCRKGDLCEYAHGVFEYWLHPARYRTRFCNAGMFCKRKVCFFAHSVHEIRPTTRHKCHCHSLMNGATGGVTSLGETSSSMILPHISIPSVTYENQMEINWEEIMVNLSVLNFGNVRQEEHTIMNMNATDFSSIDWSDSPNMEWVSELVDSD
ncbi:hypothetical protein ACHQM5_007308 [Ranunculus cassubicifolius]